ncbi:hypothetical protein [Treponema brennaborense]|uniref:Lipoprotein n=1 Tax=Treponema brennaborense (strain DSM 12168 / CIP 105900 / DD5/3) TaxID=906968 RepID=F4LMS0_TREBD|nr:hypothetical protein [Treponema brennaborense]AEE17810.1 hypothetical protein Trebr_2403 [Treponema brennaborense DSM 12168]
MKKIFRNVLPLGVFLGVLVSFPALSVFAEDVTGKKDAFKITFPDTYHITVEKAVDSEDAKEVFTIAKKGNDYYFSQTGEFPEEQFYIFENGQWRDLSYSFEDACFYDYGTGDADPRDTLMNDEYDNRYADQMLLRKLWKEFDDGSIKRMERTGKTLKIAGVVCDEYKSYGIDDIVYSVSYIEPQTKLCLKHILFGETVTVCVKFSKTVSWGAGGLPEIPAACIPY